jgi:hypothetical protein
VGENARPVVFCSHASPDKPRVKEFAERLRVDGIDAWVDGWEIGSGDDLVARINEGLARASAGLVFFSRHTAKSVWVNAEISALTYRAVQGLEVIPVLLDDDAELPPLLEHVLRRSVEEYEAIRDTLLGRVFRPALGVLPQRMWREMVVRLAPAEGEAVRVRVWWGGEQIADRSGPLPRLLTPADGSRPSEAMLNEIGRACGSLLFPAGAADRLNRFALDRRQGDRLDVVVEAEGALSRLPVEAARLPVPGTPLLVGLDGVTLYRRPLEPPARLTPALPGPLKILIAIAAPDEGKTAASVLDGERELDRILRALPEHGAQARPLEVAGLNEIAGALAKDSYHVVHLSGHGSAEGIELEDEDGNPVIAAPADIVAAIERGTPLPLLFLSCCDPVTVADTAPGLAEALLSAGLSQVVALRGNVTDQYATSLAAKFYELLAGNHTIAPPEALAAARRDLERERAAAARRGAAAPPEYATATIFCAGAPQPVVADGPPEPLRIRTTLTPSGPVPALGVDDLVGRRAEVRTALRVLCDDPRTVRALGSRAGVTLCGLGGVGKSTVAGRVMARMTDRGWVTATVAGPVELSALCTAVGTALAELPTGAPLELASRLLQPAADVLRIPWLRQALRDHRVLLVLDNFEDNLIDGGEAFRDEATGSLVGDLLATARRGRVLITSRYPVGPFATRLHDVRILPLSRAHARKLLLRLPALEHLSAAGTGSVLRVTGGHPRLIELVDAAMRGNPSRLTSMAGRLERYAAELGIDLSTPRENLTAALTDALDIALRDIALTDLVHDLPPDATEVLLQAAVSTIPVTAADLAATTGRDTGPSLALLVRRTLLTPLAADVYFVERWTAQGLRRIDDPMAWRKRCRQAADRRMTPDGQRIDIIDAMEAARNLLDADDLDEAAGLAANAADFLRQSGQLLILAGFAGEILAELPLAIPDARVLAQYEADANLALGLTTAATQRWTHLADQLEQLGVAEPDRADY